MKTARLTGKVAIVTGAAQGIGAIYAKALASEGASIVVADIADASALLSEFEKAGTRAIQVKTDVANAASVKIMADTAAAAFGRIDILVNNAAIFTTLKFKPFEEIDTAEWDRVMAVNIRGPFECAKAVVPHMARNNYGKIVNISSGTVFKGAPFLLHYVSSKGAIIAMTRSLARELGDRGIRVNSIAPGLIMTEHVSANPSYKDAVVEGNVASRSIKRTASPDDLTGTLAYLCSAESDFVTGQCVVVDGGSIMH